MSGLLDFIADQNSKSDLADWAQANLGSTNPGLAQLAKADPNSFRQLLPSIIGQQMQQSALSQLAGGDQQQPTQQSQVLPQYGSMGDSQPNAPIPQGLPSAMSQMPTQAAPVSPRQPSQQSALAMLPTLVRASGGNLSQAVSALKEIRTLQNPVGTTLGQDMMWDPNNPGHAIQVPGTILKGANGEVLSVDANGNPTQQVPPNPEAKNKFENNLQQIADKFDQLHKLGGTVEEGNGFWENKGTQLAASDDMHLPEWIGGGDIPGGQTILQGTPAQSLRDDIEGLTKQTLPLYMQANGITPGMERAQSAQAMLLAALGGAVGKSRQHIMSNLAGLSSQSGTGALASQLRGAYSQTSASPQSALSQVSQPQAGSITPAMAQAELARRAQMRGQ